jgi:hypothetical protein
MGENRRDQTRTIGLSAARVATAAIQQAARHERALLACLSEMAGDDTPIDEQVQTVRRRAKRHAGRAVGLVRTAIRLNPDPQAEATLAALLERHERNALLADCWTPGYVLRDLPLAS